MLSALVSVVRSPLHIFGEEFRSNEVELAHLLCDFVPRVAHLLCSRFRVEGSRLTVHASWLRFQGLGISQALLENFKGQHGAQCPCTAMFPAGYASSHELLPPQGSACARVGCSAPWAGRMARLPKCSAVRTCSSLPRSPRPASWILHPSTLRTGTAASYTLHSIRPVLYSHHFTLPLTLRCVSTLGGALVPSTLNHKP
jgi:hypothetical protein